MQTVQTIIVFGDKGSGKSSIIKLLRHDGEIFGDLSPKAKADLSFEVQARRNFIEIAPFSEYSDISKTKKFSNAKHLMKYLAYNGVNLLIFVTPMGRITKTMEQNYNIIRNGLCLAKVPILLVITHCKMEVKLGSWWEDNKEHFTNQGMTFEGAISTCPVLPDSEIQQGFSEYIHPLMRVCYDETKKNLPDKVNSVTLFRAWKIDSFNAWFIVFVTTLKNIFWSPSISAPSILSPQLQEFEMIALLVAGSLFFFFMFFFINSSANLGFASAIFKIKFDVKLTFKFILMILKVCSFCLFPKFLMGVNSN